MTVGAGNFQLLSHAIALGAIADGMENKTAALFVSPQWFSPEGVPSDAYAARFSEDELLGFLENGRISGDNKNYVLDRSEELDIHVLLVSIPVNEKWYSYQGMLCDEYYEKIRSISGEYENVELVDMTEYGSEKYFLKDIMHLGWKGWARINEELYKRFTA